MALWLTSGAAVDFQTDIFIWRIQWNGWEGMEFGFHKGKMKKEGERK